MKELKDYLHLYLGCEIAIPSIADVEDWEGYILRSVSVNCECAITHADYGITFHKTEVIKPILRPLSDMTEGEGHSLEWDMWEGFPDACSGNREEILKMFINSTPDYRPGFEPMVRAINWLRKNSFDVDNLIEAGLAIDKTTLTK